jgi:hypothetical protein
MSSPSKRIVAEALAEMLVRDQHGRQLLVRRLSALDRLRLFKAIGPDLAQNPPYLGLAMLAASVRAIDDVPIPPPVREGQLEALVHQLGDDGLAAVADILADDESDSIGSVAEGNSAGTPT